MCDIADIKIQIRKSIDIKHTMLIKLKQFLKFLLTILILVYRLRLLFKMRIFGTDILVKQIVFLVRLQILIY